MVLNALILRTVKTRIIRGYRRHVQNFSSFPDIFNPTEQHQSLRSMLKTFVDKEVEPQAMEYDRDEKFNLQLFKKLGNLGILGITVPEKYGGAGMDAVAAVIANEEISSSDPSLSVSFLAHSMLFANNLARNGNDTQCMKYLPRASSGEIICGMAMTEPSGGTDILAMKSIAKRSANGNWILNGSKIWITNGAISDDELGDCFLVYARTGNSGKPNADFSMFIVEKGFKGFRLGRNIKGKCGGRASMTAQLFFEDCEIPAENLVGEEGKALICMMRNLEIERLTLAAMSLGIARRCINIMTRYAQERKAFGRPLTEYGQIQHYIAKSHADYMAGRSYAYNIARQMNLEESGNRLETDGVKLFCARMAKEVADRSIQTLGANGYIGDYAVERLWRVSKILEIGGGTNESQHKNMVHDLYKHHKKR